MTFAYDALNFLTSRTADGKTTTFGTDPNGRFTWASNAASLDSLLFDAAGRPEGQVSVRDGTVYRLLERSNRRALRDSLWMTTPWSERIQYEWDEFDQLEKLTRLDGGVSTVGYNLDRQATSTALPPGVTKDLTYPSTHRVGEISWSDGALNAAWGRKMAHDELSRTSSETRAGTDTLRAYSYDAQGRLSGYEDQVFTELTCDWDPDEGFHCTGGTFDVVDSESYSYDAVGNPADGGATVEAGNRLTAFDGFSLTWDDGGFLTTKSGNGPSQEYTHWPGTDRPHSVRPGSARIGAGASGRRGRADQRLPLRAVGEPGSDAHRRGGERPAVHRPAVGSGAEPLPQPNPRLRSGHTEVHLRGSDRITGWDESVRVCRQRSGERDGPLRAPERDPDRL